MDPLNQKVIDSRLPSCSVAPTGESFPSVSFEKVPSIAPSPDVHPGKTHAQQSLTEDLKFAGIDESTTAARTNPAMSSDFITNYADYADVLEVPREMHEGVARQYVAAVLNRNGVTIPHGALIYSLDFWQIFLSGSGCGRSTLVGMARPILKGADLSTLEQDALWGSPQALYQQFAIDPSALFVWGELGERLKLLSEPRFGGAKQWLTDRYDNLSIPAPVTYRKTANARRNTPSIVFASAPRIGILATSSEAWFFENLEVSDSSGGFIPRFLIQRVNSPTRDVPTTQKRDDRWVEGLASQLREIAKLQGEADISAILPDYDRWYSETKRRFEAQANKALAMAFFNRHRVHVLKLAVINEASSNHSLKVSEASWSRAVITARKAEDTIFSLLGTGMNSEGYVLSQLEDLVRAAGSDGISLSEITRAFQHLSRRTKNQHLLTLLNSKKIHGYCRDTKGRAATIFVHEDHHSHYREKHPKEKIITAFSSLH